MTETPSLAQAMRVFARIGLLSFGGPAAQIALMHKELVDDRPWMDEHQFLSALSFCMLLPGPEAMQLATYAGWRFHGVCGGLIAGLLFVIPGALVVLGLAMLYAAYGQVPWIDAMFLGVQATVVVIVIEALLRISKKALKRPAHWAIAALSFIGIFFLNLPFPLIILLAGVFGAVIGSGDATILPASARSNPLGTITTWLTIWWAPVAVLWLSGAEFLTEIALFFSKLAIVTFGGAYAVLAYMTQAAVSYQGWLSTEQMMDGLGLAETTPGPLILVTEFVGYIAAYGQGGLWLGIAGAIVALWVTFVPCFLWIFTGAPFIDWFASKPRLNSALIAITAAVVGVILNLSIWFSLHVFFAKLTQVSVGPAQFLAPEISSLDWRVVVLAAGASLLILRLHWNLLWVLALAAIGGIAVATV